MPCPQLPMPFLSYASCCPARLGFLLQLYRRVACDSGFLHRLRQTFGCGADRWIILRRKAGRGAQQIAAESLVLGAQNCWHARLAPAASFRHVRVAHTVLSLCRGIEPTFSPVCSANKEREHFQDYSGIQEPDWLSSMAERLVATGCPIDWCECALKNSSGLEVAVQQFQRWQDEAQRGSTPNVHDYAASNSLTPCSSNGFLPSVSVSYAESTGGSTNRVRLFPVTSSSEAVVPQGSHNWQNHQQLQLPKSQESKREFSGELERIRKLFRYKPTEDAIVDNARPGINHGSSSGESQRDCATSKMDSLHDDSQTRNQPAEGPYFAPADVFNHEHGRTRRNGGRLDLDGERVRMRDLAFQSAAMRMSEAAQIFRGGLQPDVGEIGPAFEFPACPDNDEEEDERGVDEGWTSIMDIDEPHTVSVPVGRGDSLYVASTGTSTEDDNQSVDGPEFAPHSQRGNAGFERLKCVTNQQSVGFDTDHGSCDIGQSAKYRGRIPSSSWCPDPPRKLQRTHPHDPGIGAVNMDETGGGSRSGSGRWRHQSQLSFGVARGEDDEFPREGKAQGRQ